ncbi:hypothetical protein RRF57_012896 [Xylaria bambusicola]|uniref:Uncharacterized protein n=1 Tax=Xylaria bambusicola TaxID=326684 RepID=A0AAN7V4P5_9PEZI
MRPEGVKDSLDHRFKIALQKKPVFRASGDDALSWRIERQNCISARKSARNGEMIKFFLDSVEPLHLDGDWYLSIGLTIRALAR